MELVNDFTVKADIDETWKTLIDLELIAPCMPGAELTEIEGEIHRGLVKIKVGPITAKFKGEAHFLERDADRHRAVLKGDGRDTGGKGNASALITAQLSEIDPKNTKVVVTTDLTITGKVAQFGRGALADVSDKLLKQFVHNLETTVLNQGAEHDATSPASATPLAEEPAGEPAETLPPPTAERVAEAPAAPTIRKVDGKPAEPIDLLETAGAPMLKRLAPIVLALLAVFFLVRRRRRR